MTYKRKEIIGDCVLYLGDCLEVMPTLDKVDAVVTDPPYGTTKCKWDAVLPFDDMWNAINGVSKEKTPIIITASQPFTSALIMSNLKMFKYELIWNKMKGTAPGVAKHRPMPAHESMVIFGKGKLATYNPQWLEGKPYVDNRSSTKLRDQENGHQFGYNGVFKSSSDGRRYPISVINLLKTSVKGQHPTQKPVDLMEYLVKTYTNEGDVVLDFTMGSGTTGVACAKLWRKFIGIELDENYFIIACERITKAYEQPDLFVEAPKKMQQKDLF